MTQTTTTRWGLAILLLTAATTAQAQFVGARSLFMMSSLLDNPAATGQSPCVDMRMGARAQWVGFEGAPNAICLFVGAIGEQHHILARVGRPLDA